MRFVFVTIGLLMLAPAAQAEFWCERATFNTLNRAEQTICRSRVLRAMDQRMADLYLARMAQADAREKRRLKDEQTQKWRAFRDTCRADADCLETRYAFRIRELGGKPPQGRDTTPRQQPANYTITEDGIIETPGENGVVRLYDPALRRTGKRFPGGPDLWNTFRTGTNPVGVPELPGQHSGYSNVVAGHVKKLSGLTFTDSQLEKLRARESGTYFQFMDLYLNAMVYLKELEQ